MKICHILASANRAGAEVLVAQLAKESQRCCRAAVLLLQRGPLEDLLSAHGVEYKVVSVRSAHDAYGVVVLSAALLRERYDVVHVHGARAALYGGVAARLCQVPVLVATIHELSVFGNGNRISRWIENIVYRTLVDRVCCVSAACARNAADVRNIAANKVAVVYNGTSVKLVGDRRRGVARVIGAIGRLTHAKGFDRLVAAFDLICRIVPDVQLVIAGDGPEETRLRSAVSTRCANRVQFLGRIDDVGTFFRSIDVLVVPSRTESFGLVVVEAFASQVPVVATAVDGLPELLQNGVCGALVADDGPDALASAVSKVLRDSELRSSYVRNGIARLSSFSIHQCARQYHNHYRALLTSRASPVL